MMWMARSGGNDPVRDTVRAKLDRDGKIAGEERILSVIVVKDFPGRVAKDRHGAKDGTDAERLWKFAIDGDVDRAIGKQFRERRVPRPP